MSSILDALNKLEQDRADAQRSSEGLDIDPISAAQELVGPSALRDHITIRFLPVTLILGGLAFVLVLVSLSVGVSLLIVRSSVPKAVITTDAAAQGTTVAASVTAPTQEPPPEEVSSSVVAAEPEASERFALEAPKDQSNRVEESSGSMEAPETVPALDMTPPTPYRTSPEIAQMAKVEVTTPVEDVTNSLDGAQRSGIVAPQERILDAGSSVPELLSPFNRGAIGARAEPESTALSLKELPFLTQADRARYADGPLMVNMVSPVSETNPYGSAVINVITVFEGQNIPGTQFRLIGVEIGGIGVAVQGTTKRFFIPW